MASAAKEPVGSGSAFGPVGPDPREFKYIPVKELEIDPGEQREITEARQKRIDWIRDNWDWNKCEVITVRFTAAGTYKVIEGQGRVLALLARDPDALMPCFLLPATAQEAAAVAAGIASNRTPHGRFDYWKLKVRQGEPHEIAAERAFAIRQLAIHNATGPYRIAAVYEVEEIIKTYTPEAGAAVLGQVLDVIRKAWPDHQSDNIRNRWNAPILRVVWRILKENDDIQVDRLSRILGGRPANQWIAIRKESTLKDKDGAVITVIAQAYNSRLRTGRMVSP